MDTGELQTTFQIIGSVLGVLVIGICIPIAIWLIKKGLDSKKPKSEEQEKIDNEMLIKVTATHVLVKDTREDVRDIKVDITDIKKTQIDHEKRLTGIEKEHKMYSKKFHCEPKKDKTKEMKYVRVLIVDDQQEVVALLDDFFHKILPDNPYWKNKYIFQVDGANTFDEGTEKIDEGKYQLALIDYKLNDEDFRTGFHLAQYCQKKGLDNFFIYSADENLKKIPKEFVSRFLIKPITDEEWVLFENRLKETI